GSLDHLREVPGDKLFFVHINDCEDLPRDKLADKHRLFCGEGVIPLVDVLKIFREKGYEGYLSVEIFREEYWKMNVLEIAKKAYSSLVKVASSAGVSLD
ncbi:MAG: isomerase, partial [Thermoprotei archaeon]